VHEREAFAIVDALTHWRHYLESTKEFEVETDHKSLLYLQTQKEISKKQARWLEKLASFNFKVKYIPGESQVIADALSRPAGVDAHEVMVEPAQPDWTEDYNADAYFGPIWRGEVKASQYSIKNKRVYLEQDGKSRLGVPPGAAREHVLQEHHDARLAGHRGRRATYESLRAGMFWPGMRKDIEAYVDSCLQCQKSKPDGRGTAGLLQPLPVPQRPWQSVGLDFMGPLPRSRSGKDFLLVLADRMSKRVHLIPTHQTVTSEATATLLMQHLVRLHGVPQSLVSDRDPRFTADVWKALWELLGTELKMSTAAHPQTDGQTERANRTINEVLRTCVSESGTDWEEQLPYVEFAMNSAYTESLGCSPFEADLGFAPQPFWQLSGGRLNGRLQGIMQGKRRFIEVQRRLIRAQEQMKRTANRSRREVAYIPGDEVLLRARVFGRESRQKWSAKWLGPFKVLEARGNVVKLDLPQDGPYNVINVSMVKKFHQRTSDQDGLVKETPPPLEASQDLKEGSKTEASDQKIQSRKKSVEEIATRSSTRPPIPRRRFQIEE
jgi:hypothetical protein